MTNQGAQQFYNIYGYWPAGFGPDAIPPFAPNYEGHVIRTGAGDPLTLNYLYFADGPTADEIMRRFSADHVALVPYLGAGGPNKTDPAAMERWVVFRDGTAVNAGLLASNFTRNPENFYPHVAENACWRDIASARAAGQKLPTNAIGN